MICARETLETENCKPELGEYLSLGKMNLAKLLGLNFLSSIFNPDFEPSA
jgi:hypothetical protein